MIRRASARAYEPYQSLVDLLVSEVDEYDEADNCRLIAREARLRSGYDRASRSDRVGGSAMDRLPVGRVVDDHSRGSAALPLSGTVTVPAAGESGSTADLLGRG